MRGAGRLAVQRHDDRRGSGRADDNLTYKSLLLRGNSLERIARAKSQFGGTVLQHKHMRAHERGINNLRPVGEEARHLFTYGPRSLIRTCHACSGNFGLQLLTNERVGSFVVVAAIEAGDRAVSGIEDDPPVPI
jgi:hypothetical protein